MQKYIIYRAGSDLHSIYECRYALLKYLSVYNLKPPKDTALVVYTSQPGQFEAFIPFFHCFQLKECPQAGRTKTDFIHYLSENYQGSLLYFESDTYVLHPLEAVFQKIQSGSFCLHRRKEPVRSRLLFQQKLKKYFSLQPFLKQQNVELPERLPAFTTHAVGFQANGNRIFSEVSTLQHSLAPYLPAETAEQIAFGYVLQPKTVITLQDQVMSYGDFPEFKSLLHQFFRKNEVESIPNLIKELHKLDAEKLRREKENYEQLPLLKKLVNTLTGKAWSIRQYRNKL